MFKKTSAFIIILIIINTCKSSKLIRINKSRLHKETKSSTEMNDNNSSITTPSSQQAQADSKYDNMKAYLKVENKKGVTHAVRWVHQYAHPITILRNGKVHRYDYADIWLAKALSSVYRILYAKHNVKKITHWGIYTYRKIAGRNRLSKHSYALAIDIPTFYLQDNTVLNINDDWGNGVKGQKLLAIRDEFCKVFDVVLSPKYNYAHRNHFHLNFNRKNRNFKDRLEPKYANISHINNSFGLTNHLKKGEEETELQVQYSDGDEGESLDSFSLIGSTCK